MIYAQVKDNLIKNTIILDDSSLETIFIEGFDYLIRIDTLDIIPGPLWTYNSDTQEFSPPAVE